MKSSIRRNATQCSKRRNFSIWSLRSNPDNFDPQRLNCLWHGGHIAEVKVSDKLSIDISVCGDVCADLYDEYCNHIEHLKDKGNNAVFADVMEDISEMIPT